MLIDRIIKFMNLKIFGRIRIVLIKLKYRTNNTFIINSKFISNNIKINAHKNSVVNIENICEGAGKVTINIREGAKLYIGNNVCINSGCLFTVRKELIIGKDVMFGPNVLIFDHDHDYKSINWKERYVAKSIFIGENVWIGANSIILKGAEIGNNVVIAAGSIVSGKIPDNSIYKNKIIPEFIEYKR